MAFSESVVNQPEMQLALLSHGLALFGRVFGAGIVVFGLMLFTLLAMLPVVVML